LILFTFTELFAVHIPTENLIENIPVYVPLCPNCPQCEPYSEEACILATISIGFQPGTIKSTGHVFSRVRQWKGCYAYPTGIYEGFSFYGAGGSEDEMKLPPSGNQGGIFRPKGYDCK